MLENGWTKALELLEKIARYREAAIDCLEQYFDNYDGELLPGHIWAFIEEICEQDGVAYGPDMLPHIDALLNPGVS